MELDSKTWSTLPSELVALVILATSDLETLAAWRTATAHNRMLAGAVLRSQWRDVIIDEHDLVPAPGKDAKRAARKARELAEEGYHVRAGSRLNSAFDLQVQGQAVLHAVERLSLSFLFWRTRDRRLRDSEELEYRLPSADTLEYSLERLRPGLKRVRDIVLAGRVVQAMLEMVFHLPSPGGVRSLIIERSPAFGWFYYRPYTRKGPARQEILSMQAVGSMTGLRHLEVLSLCPIEAEGLAKAITCLENLESLVIQDPRLDPWLARDGHVTRKSPLLSFMSALVNIDRLGFGGDLARSRASCFPQKLRSLTMVADSWCFYTDE